jgi:hypothetical protein
MEAQPPKSSSAKEIIIPFADLFIIYPFEYIAVQVCNRDTPVKLNQR